MIQGRYTTRLFTDTETLKIRKIRDSEIKESKIQIRRLEGFKIQRFREIKI